MSDTLSRVGAVIVTYASSTTIEACLSVLPVTRLAGVVVVDNDSPDDTVSKVRAHAGAALVEHGGNPGFGAAANTGASHLGAELLLFLNPDAVVTAGALEALVAHLDAHPHCGLVGPRLRCGAAPMVSCGRPASMWSELRLVAPAPLARHLPARRLPPSYEDTGPVGYVEGACMLVRRDVWERSGRFDPEFFLFYEELDLARRLARLGFSVDLCSAASVEHIGAVSRARLADGGRAELIRSAARYLRKWHGPVAATTFVLTARSAWWLQARRGRLDGAAHRRLLEAVAR